MPTHSTEAYTSANKQKYSRNSRIAQWHLNSVMEAIYQLLAETEGTSILDAGCGEGFLTDYLARRDSSLRLTGVDMSSEAIAYAEDMFGERVRFRMGNVYKLPFSDNSFDVVLCSEVLEHLDDPDLATRELTRVARRHVIITVPNEPYFRWLNDLARALGICMDPGHINFWTKSTFETFIRSHFDNPVFSRKHMIYQLVLARKRFVAAI